MRVWLTGASGGIGAALARLAAARGAVVFASGRDADKLQALAQSPGDIRPLPFDIRDRDATLRAANDIAAQTGAIDLAILNAGDCEYLDVREWDAQLIRRVMEANFFGFANCAEAALPLLRKSAASGETTSRPILAGVCSAAVYCGLPRAEAYAASKSAVRAFLRAMEGDLARDNIAVSVVCPGFVKTPLTDRNDFPMPLLMTADRAAKIILNGLEKGRAEIAFPKRLIWGLKLLDSLPANLRVGILARMARA